MNGSYAGNPKRKLQHAIALIECVLSHKTANRIPGIEIARKAAIPILKRARPPIRKRGSYSLTLRDQSIVEAVASICRQYDFKPTRNPASRDEEHAPCGCSIVADALSKLGIKLGEKRITNIWFKMYPN